ncbi:hypothetical protein BDW42DRAFT_177756 [Aspergillus taichungensis]|uniref:Uncharacterized protein n=1 Tax=Aspergillus taichungensis TaxID=482145 RepID=A0A2J5HIV4_9EURO|nr:hypothetical protein BDW42DRAFT_177756 [Aspergillus taichungensis]
MIVIMMVQRGGSLIRCHHSFSSSVSVYTYHLAFISWFLFFFFYTTFSLHTHTQTILILAIYIKYSPIYKSRVKKPPTWKKTINNKIKLY